MQHLRPASRVDQVDLGLPNRVKSVCSSVTVEIFMAPSVSLQVISS